MKTASRPVFKKRKPLYTATVRRLYAATYAYLGREPTNAEMRKVIEDNSHDAHVFPHHMQTLYQLKTFAKAAGVSLPQYLGLPPVAGSQTVSSETPDKPELPAASETVAKPRGNLIGDIVRIGRVSRSLSRIIGWDGVYKLLAYVQEGNDK